MDMISAWVDGVDMDDHGCTYCLKLARISSYMLMQRVCQRFSSHWFPVPLKDAVASFQQHHLTTRLWNVYRD